jgi:predicted Zn-dependent protease
MVISYVISLFIRVNRLIFTPLLLAICLITPPSWAYSPYSNRELDDLEKEFIQQINLSDSVVRDPLASQYINHLAKRLATHGQMAQPFFFIVRSNEINAFAGPGGYIGVNSQLILSTQNESELAAVMSHEMSHVRQHHLYRMIEHEKQMRVPMLATMLASIALGAINPALGSGAVMASMTGFAQDSISFTRSNEKEADRIGIDMLIKSGLDPRGMANFFRRMQENTRYYYTENIPAILRTHPLDDDRIAEAENRCPAPRPSGYPESLDYRLFKELIRVSVNKDSKQLLDYYQHQCPDINSQNVSCQYGYALTLMTINRFQQAQARIEPLLRINPYQMNYAIAMAQAEQGQGDYAHAVQLLQALHENYPEDYAAAFEYARALMEANQYEKATNLLLKSVRLYKQDLPLCRLLARAQAATHHKDHAYFTHAQCFLLQGRKHDAINALKLAKTLVGKDKLMQERINAKIDEIKST